LSKEPIVTESHALEVLGGPKVLGRRVRSLLEVADLGTEGLPRASAERVRDRLGLTNDELARSLGTSARTLQRRARSSRSRLDPVQGDRLYRLARIVAFAEEVLEDRDRARHWIREPQRGLGGRTPLDLSRTEAGAREVEDLLGRIEHGVFS
jgi:putative toxin-antitoxin system antitoxin component (TIGR02293 family)